MKTKLLITTQALAAIILFSSCGGTVGGTRNARYIEGGSEEGDGLNFRVYVGSLVLHLVIDRIAQVPETAIYDVHLIRQLLCIEHHGLTFGG